MLVPVILFASQSRMPLEGWNSRHDTCRCSAFVACLWKTGWPPFASNASCSPLVWEISKYKVRGLWVVAKFNYRTRCWLTSTIDGHVVSVHVGDAKLTASCVQGKKFWSQHVALRDARGYISLVWKLSIQNGVLFSFTQLVSYPVE